MNVLVEKQGAVAVVTVNRPEVRNALDNATVEEIEVIVGQLEADDGIRAVIFTGAGDKAFIAGADIREVARRDIGRGRFCQHCRRQRLLPRSGSGTGTGLYSARGR